MSIETLRTYLSESGLVAVWFNIKSGDDMSLGGTKPLPDP